MLSANYEHLRALLLIQAFVNLAQASDEILMDQRRISLQIEEGLLLVDIFETDKFASQCADLRAALSDRKKSLSCINETCIVVWSEVLHLSPYGLLAFAELDQGQIESHIRRIILEIVD